MADSCQWQVDSEAAADERRARWRRTGAWHRVIVTGCHRGTRLLCGLPHGGTPSSIDGAVRQKTCRSLHRLATKYEHFVQAAASDLSCRLSSDRCAGTGNRACRKRRRSESIPIGARLLGLDRPRTVAELKRR